MSIRLRGILLLGIIGLTCAGLNCALATAGRERNANELEISYAQIAEGSGLRQFCDRIYPWATGGAGFNPPGRQSWYTRSLCLYDVAVTTKDERLCGEVVPRRALLSDGSDISPAGCRKEIAERRAHPPPIPPPPGPQIGVVPSGVKPILQRMGYTDSMLPEDLRGSPPEDRRWTHFLQSIVLTPDFIARIARLQDFTSVAEEVETTVCEAPFIPNPVRRYTGREKGCCMDINRSGVCDDEEFKGERADATKIVLEPVPGKPPHSICGSRTLEVEILVHNRGAVDIRPGSGYLILSPNDPPLFRLSEAEMRQALPAIPAGGSVTIRYPNLRRSNERSPCQATAMVCLTDLDCSKALEYHTNIRTMTSDECVSGNDLRSDFGPCRAPSIADRQTAGCCLDVDRDNVCDDREWETSAARPASVGLSFPKPIRGSNLQRTIEEGAPFEVSLSIRNTGPVPLSGHDGFVRLRIPARIVAPQGDRRRADPMLALPDLKPGSEAVMTFRDLSFRPGAKEIAVQYDRFVAVLCMAGGCEERGSVLAEFRIKDADEKIKDPERIRADQERRQAGAWVRELRNEDESYTRLASDPEAVPVTGGWAPDFSTEDADDRLVRLFLLRDKKNALLVFCPDLRSPSCRARLTALSAVMPQFQGLDTEVLVIAAGKAKDRQDLHRRYGPGFTWLGDLGLKITACYARFFPGEEAQPRPLLVLVDKRGRIARMADDPSGTSPSTTSLLESIKTTVARAAL